MLFLVCEALRYRHFLAGDEKLNTAESCLHTQSKNNESECMTAKGMLCTALMAYNNHYTQPQTQTTHAVPFIQKAE